VAVLRREPAQVGTIAGSVTDAKTGTALGGATIVIEGTSLGTTSGSDGHYRIRDVSPGTYTVRTRYIGYIPSSASVTVSSDQEATADFGLAKSVQKLDEVVTTGTVVPTEVKAIPTPVTVITADEIASQHVKKTDQLFRQSVPSAVAWDYSTDPEFTPMSLRGAGSLLAYNATMKVYLDGVEITDRTFAAIDPNSIERIEVIRGPQAATIYGSDALSGVMRVFSKRGGSETAPQVDAQAALGVLQSPYSNFDGGSALRQEYAGALRGGVSSMSYNLGGSYTHVGDWLPFVAQSLPSVYGGMRATQGPLSVDISGRYYVQHQETERNPLLAQTGFADFTRPLFDRERNQEQTYGAHVAYAATPSWRHDVTVGYDQLLIDIPQSHPRLTTPDDTLLSVFNQNQSKASIAYNTSLLLRLSSAVSATVAVGADHYEARNDTYFAFGTLNTTGTIVSDPNQSFQLITRGLTTNTGYFAQAQVAIQDALYVTAGLRAEKNSNFGSDLGTPLSPRIGISFVQPIADATLKVRGSYGESIRPPAVGQGDALSTATQEQLANPTLAPERQRGWDAGADWVFGTRGSLGITYYRQVALDAIQLVDVNAGAVPPVRQFQNVGRVKNRGLELEGALRLGPAQLRAQYAITNSTPEDLGPGYTGDLRIGDQVIGIPKYTGGGSVTVSPWVGTSFSAGLTYVGSWTNYDYLEEFSCFAGTGPCGTSTRDYLTTYPGFFKANASIDQELRPGVSAFLSVHNLTNKEAFEFNNLYPVTGRLTMAGVRVQH
jgi:outer membrane receptor protein involved in Fe transport